MPRYFTITIPTKPFLKKFIQHQYGVPVILCLDDYFGMVIASVLEKNVYPNRSLELTHRAFDKYTAQLTIQLPISWLNNYYYGTGVEPRKAVFINKMFEYFFEKELFLYCSVHAALKKERKESIENFCKDYNIEIDEDITYDNLKQTEYRFRKRKENKKHSNLSLINSTLESYTKQQLFS